MFLTIKLNDFFSSDENIPDSSLTPLLGEAHDSCKKDKENTEVVSESVGINCQQAIKANTDSE